MDNTLTDFDGAVIRYLHENFDYEGGLNRDVHKGYGILEGIYPRLSKAQLSPVYEDMFSHIGFWSGMDPLSDSIEALSKLYKEHDVFIVTKPWPTADNCIPEKLSWIYENLPFFDMTKIIFCGHKHLLHADVMIDDSPRFLESSNCKTTIAINYPYNEKTEADYKVNGWLEIQEILL